MTIETIAIEGLTTPVSRIGLGTWAIGGWMWGGTDEKDSIAVIRRALDSGVNLIDTAPVYGFGASEEIVGKALADGYRHKAVIATKVALEWQDGAVFRNSSPVRIRQEVEDTLRRLRTDYIDLYQVHWPDPLVPIEQTAAVLDDLRKEGKVLALGVSNFSPAQMDAFRRVAPLSATQPPYNLFERDIDRDVLPYAKQHGLVALAYGTLCRGLLAGRIGVDTRFEGDDLRQRDPKFCEPRREQYVAAVKALDVFARENFDKSVLALAVRWVLDRGPTIALWGARRPAQLDGIEDVFGWRLDEKAFEQIDAIVAQFVKDPIGPEFMAPPRRVQLA
ncbi:aryl-alcohol dehydrogenase-like predicted oxidoreductase [Paraburkholderia fungorum]|jgi:aryl-alcohol dehydrogenase-like predicted oxidoreductase|uniref:aldo/keto reductase n=1 Tax=Paraburkholderia fungorum TaxID=134537 RepID=UPI000D076765|nr:aldo/keto reductase [Paraburkholderia fungorum]PRZ54301.1 aryl-alcohol dehydrogenase-like predicted oxidoreductase [Paraburkholderia fungorum]